MHSLTLAPKMVFTVIRSVSLHLLFGGPLGVQVRQKLQGKRLTDQAMKKRPRPRRATVSWGKTAGFSGALYRSIDSTLIVIVGTGLWFFGFWPKGLLEMGEEALEAFRPVKQLLRRRRKEKSDR